MSGAWHLWVGLPWSASAEPESLPQAVLTGVSCYSLTRLALASEFGREIPRIPWNGLGGVEIPLCEAQAGDVVAFEAARQGGPLPVHIGLLAAPGSVLHIEGPGMLSRIDGLESLKCRIRMALRV